MFQLMLAGAIAVEFFLGLILLVLIQRSENKILIAQYYCPHHVTQCVECGLVFRRSKRLRGK